MNIKKIFPIKKAFTLIEMLISIAIVTVIMSVVLYNYGAFNDSLALSAAGQEMATAVRKAQAYGISGKEGTKGTFTSSYGIYVDPNDPSNYIIFVDKNNNGRYDPVPGCGNTASECVQKVPLNNGLSLGSICATAFDGSVTCPSANSLKTIQILFKRPSPEGFIHIVNRDGTTDNIDFKTAQIGLTTSKGRQSSVAINFTGQTTTNVPTTQMCQRPAPASGCAWVDASTVQNPQNVTCGMVQDCSQCQSDATSRLTVVNNGTHNWKRVYYNTEDPDYYYTAISYTQDFTLTNNSQVNVAGPVNLALGPLNSNYSTYTITNAAGTTSCFVPTNSAYIVVQSGVIPANGGSVNASVNIISPTTKTARVINGIPVVFATKRCASSTGTAVSAGCGEKAIDTAYVMSGVGKQ